MPFSRYAPRWWYFQSTGSWTLWVRAFRQWRSSVYLSSVPLVPVSAKSGRSAATRAQERPAVPATRGVRYGQRVGFDQYHEPPEELSQETRTLARMFASLTEEAEAINWYEQRLSVEQDPEARSIIEDARHEEYKHFSMDLEFLLRRRPEWRRSRRECSSGPAT